MGTDCTTSLPPSVRLEVVDAESGDALAAMVSYELDGEGPSEAEELSPGEYILGQDEAGTFQVTVSADGYLTVTEDYEVTGDECHVTTVDATVELMTAP
jgi:hypothetical protein